MTLNTLIVTINGWMVTNNGSDDDEDNDDEEPESHKRWCGLSANSSCHHVISKTISKMWPAIF